MAEVSDRLTRFIEEFCGEWTCADTGAVGFHDTIDVANLVGTDAKTCAGTCADGVRRGDKRIGTEVNVEHRTLGTLTEHALAALENIVDLML